MHNLNMNHHHNKNMNFHIWSSLDKVMDILKDNVNLECSVVIIDREQWYKCIVPLYTLTHLHKIIIFIFFH